MALSGNTTGGNNTALGRTALSKNTTGQSNTALGSLALSRNTTGIGNTAAGLEALRNNSEGEHNTATGTSALFINTTGEHNTGVGASALANNTTGNDNTALGYKAEVDADNLTNATAIGANAVVNASNKIRLGDDNVTLVETAGTVSAAAFVGDGSGLTGLSGSPWETTENDIFYNTGNVGIGTDNPDRNLHIFENKNGVVGLKIENLNSGGLSKERIFFSNEDGDGAGLQVSDDDAGGEDASSMALFNNRPGGKIQFTTAGLRRMIVANNGNVGIGTTTPSDKLHLNTAAGTDMKIFFSESGNPAVSLFYEGSAGPGTNNLIHMRSEISGNEANVMTWKLNGNVGIGASSPTERLHVNGNALANAHTTPSSRRWKTNIQTLENPLEKVQALRGVSYDWKESGKHDIGLIAEEVGEVIPEIVAYEENGVDAKSVDYARLVAVLIEAVKEQQKTIHDLKKGHKQLATKVDRLEKQFTQTSLAKK